jgi:hypothetical protein
MALSTFAGQTIKTPWDSDTTILTVIIVVVVVVGIIMATNNPVSQWILGKLGNRITAASAQEKLVEAYAGGVMRREGMAFTDAASPWNSVQIGNETIEAATPEVNDELNKLMS